MAENRQRTRINKWTALFVTEMVVGVIWLYRSDWSEPLAYALLIGGAALAASMMFRAVRCWLDANPAPAHMVNWQPELFSLASPSREETEAGNKSGYAKYLKSHSWKMKRRTVLGRANHRCQLCDTRFRLEVHHRTYKRLGNERDGDLIVLCSSCHARRHGKLRA
jgi:hypothetical protein